MWSNLFANLTVVGSIHAIPPTATGVTPGTNVFVFSNLTGQSMVMDSSGKVGIGATNPISTLQITGNVYASNSITTTNLFATGNVVIGPSPSILRANLHVEQGDIFVGNTLVTGADFSTTGSNRLIFDNSSNTANGPNKIVLFSNTAGNFAAGLGITSLTSSTVSMAYWAYNAHQFYSGGLTSPYVVGGFTNGSTFTVGTVPSFNAKFYVTGGAPTSNIMARIDASNVALVTSGSGLVGFGTLTPTANLHVVGNIYASNAVTTTNVFTANVTATGIQTIAGLAGRTTLNVTGNLYVSNAVTTTNVYLTPGITDSTSGQVVKGALEFNGTSNVFYGTSSTIRGLIPVQYFYQLNADTAFGTTTSAVVVPAFPGMVNGVQLQNGKYYMKMIHLVTITTSATPGNTQLNMLLGSGTAGVSIVGCGVFSQNVTSTTGPGSTISVTSVNTVYYTGNSTERISAITTATSTATTYYTTLEGTFSVVTPGGMYPVASFTSPGTFTATPGVRRGSFIYIQKIGDNSADVNIGGWS